MRLQVTPGELEVLASGLSSLLSELELAGDIRSISSAPAENAELQASIEHLVVRWTEDIHDLQAKLKDLSGRLDSASVAYDHVERNVTHNISLVTPSAETVSRELEV